MLPWPELLQPGSRQPCSRIPERGPLAAGSAPALVLGCTDSLFGCLEVRFGHVGRSATTRTSLVNLRVGGLSLSLCQGLPTRPRTSLANLQVGGLTLSLCQGLLTWPCTKVAPQMEGLTPPMFGRPGV